MDPHELNVRCQAASTVLISLHEADSFISEQIEDCSAQLQKTLNNFHAKLVQKLKEAENVSESVQASLESRQVQRQDLNLKLETGKLNLERRQQDEKAARSRLEEVIKSLQELDGERQKISNKAVQAVEKDSPFPYLHWQRKILYNVVRLTWDEKQRKRDDGKGKILRGYVVHPTKNDVSVFEVDPSGLDGNIVSDFLWDYIAAGVGKEWK